MCGTSSHAPSMNALTLTARLRCAKRDEIAGHMSRKKEPAKEEKAVPDSTNNRQNSVVESRN